jgi:hypothetical protein
MFQHCGIKTYQFDSYNIARLELIISSSVQQPNFTILILNHIQYTGHKLNNYTRTNNIQSFQSYDST